MIKPATAWIPDDISNNILHFICLLKVSFVISFILSILSLNKKPIANAINYIEATQSWENLILAFEKAPIEIMLIGILANLVIAITAIEFEFAKENKRINKEKENLEYIANKVQYKSY